MRVIYHCKNCKKDTEHCISEEPTHIEGKKQVNELKCTLCLGNPIYVESERGKLPSYTSVEVQLPIQQTLGDELDYE